jgi:hypothetical protein
MSLQPAAAKALRTQILKVAASLNQMNYEYAKLVWRTKNELVKQPGEVVHFWLFLGFESWEKYAQEELGISYKKANKYVTVWQKFGIDLKNKWSIKDVVTITKMFFLERVVTPKNVTAWLQRAKTISDAELQEITRAQSRGKGAQMLTRLGIQIDRTRADAMYAAIDDLKDLSGIRIQGEIVYAAVIYAHSRKKHFIQTMFP